MTGVAETESEARQIFNELLDETYIAYLEGKLVGYDKRGRPAKGNVEFHAQVKPEVKAQISQRAKALGISQGDVIAYLAAVADLKLDFERQIIELKKKVQDQDNHAGQQILPCKQIMQESILATTQSQKKQETKIGTKFWCTKTYL